MVHEGRKHKIFLFISMNYVFNSSGKLQNVDYEVSLKGG